MGSSVFLMSSFVTTPLGSSFSVIVLTLFDESTQPVHVPAHQEGRAALGKLCDEHLLIVISQAGRAVDHEATILLCQLE